MKYQICETPHIVVESEPDGVHVIHYRMYINGVFVKDDSSSYAYTTQRCFPDDMGLTQWVAGVETKYKEMRRDAARPF